MNKEGLFATSVENERKFSIPKKTLIIATHPDDAEINAAGLTRSLTQGGAAVHYLVCSNGDTGTWDRSIMDRDSLARIRRLEQQEAADFLGVSSVSFLNIPDGYVWRDEGYLRSGITKAIRAIGPEMVVTHDPWKSYEFNDDHRTVGLATAHAVLLAPNHLYEADQIDEGFDPHFTPMVTFFNTDNPNLWVDLSSFYEDKEAAIRIHKSQFGSRRTFFVELKNAAESAGRAPGFSYGEAHHLTYNS